MDIAPKQFLINCFNEAVDATHPKNILEPFLPDDRTKPAVVIGAGKAAASMAAAFEKHWLGPIKGAVVTPYGHSETCHKIAVIEAPHPTPDEMSVKAAQRILKLVNNITKDEEVFTLLSGGGSSLLCLPAAGINLADKQSINNALLKSGARIDEINCVRKHLSAIKGGRLAKAIGASNLTTLAISDVVGNDPAVIASGPTVADPSTSSQAISVLNKYSIEIPTTVREWLEDPASETLKQNLDNAEYRIIGSTALAQNKVANMAQQKNLEVIQLGELDGDARLLGRKHADYLKSLKVEKPTLVISGGETTVTVKGNGRGGRNGEYLLSLLIALNKHDKIYALAADTDGIDGSERNAGAIIFPDTINRAFAAGLNPQLMLDNNDSYSFFEALDDLVVTGPTRTNVNDFRAALVLP